MMNHSDTKPVSPYETNLLARRIIEAMEPPPPIRYLGRFALHLKQNVWGCVAAESIGLDGQTKWIVIRLQNGNVLDGKVSDFRLATQEEESLLEKTFSS
jgi:hypothetical protein